MLAVVVGFLTLAACGCGNQNPVVSEIEELGGMVDIYGESPRQAGHAGGSRWH